MDEEFSLFQGLSLRLDWGSSFLGVNLMFYSGNAVHYFENCRPL